MRGRERQTAVERREEGGRYALYPPSLSRHWVMRDACIRCNIGWRWLYGPPYSDLVPVAANSRVVQWGEGLLQAWADVCLPVAASPIALSPISC